MLAQTVMTQPNTWSHHYQCQHHQHVTACTDQSMTNLTKFMIKFYKQQLLKRVSSKATSALAQNDSFSAEYRTRSDQPFTFEIVNRSPLLANTRLFEYQKM